MSGTQNQTQTQKEIKYEKPHQLLLSFIKTINEKDDKHYSYDIENKIFIPYSREVKPGIHLTCRGINPVDSPNNKVEFGNLTFYKHILTFEVCVEDDCEVKQLEFLIYRELVRYFRSEKQAWAIFYKYANQLSKTNTEYEYIVTISRGRKAKWDAMELYAIPKSVLEEFDKLIMDKISKYLQSQGYIEEKIEEETIQIPQTSEELELEEIKVEEKSEETKVEEKQIKQVEELELEEPVKLSVIKTEEKLEVKKQVEELELEEVDKRVEEKPAKSELVPLYLLSFELPSYALATMLREYELDKQTLILKEVNYIESELKKKIENLRRNFYAQCDKLFETSTLGWVTVTEEGVKFANEWNERFKSALVTFANTLIAQKLNSTSDPKLKELYLRLQNKLIARANRRIVKAIKIYIEPEDAKELLSDIVSRLNEEVEEFKRRIEEAEKKSEEKKIKWLMRELTLRELKLKMFKDVLSKIS